MSITRMVGSMAVVVGLLLAGQASAFAQAGSSVSWAAGSPVITNTVGNQNNGDFSAQGTYTLAAGWTLKDQSVNWKLSNNNGVFNGTALNQVGGDLGKNVNGVIVPMPATGGAMAAGTYTAWLTIVIEQRANGRVNTLVLTSANANIIIQ